MAASYVYVGSVGSPNVRGKVGSEGMPLGSDVFVPMKTG
jgi:hypothetical protein